MVAARIADLDNTKVANAVCAVLNSGQNYKPDQALSAFCNKPAVGTWRLEIEVNTGTCNFEINELDAYIDKFWTFMLRDTVVSNNVNQCGANLVGLILQLWITVVWELLM
ncbi:MAG: hypothetical protein U0T81_00860 [Saprospiraceae bacterium]